jgi:chromosome segregation ATPase
MIMHNNAFSSNCLQELERTLAAAQQHAIDLEAAITRISEVANEHRRKCEVLAQELGDNHDKLKSLERENQRLRGELAVLGR